MCRPPVWNPVGMDDVTAIGRREAVDVTLRYLLSLHSMTNGKATAPHDDTAAATLVWCDRSGKVYAHAEATRHATRHWRVDRM